jgi:hypothetical protein
VAVLRSLRRGAAESGRRFRITVFLYLANLAAAGILAAPMAVLVDRSIGRSALAEGLESVFRFPVILDFLRSERQALTDHFQVLGLGAIAYAILSSILSGGVIDALRSPVRSPFLPRFLGGSGRFALRFLRLLPYLGVTLGLLHFLNRGLNRLILLAFDQSTHEMAAFWTMRGKQGAMIVALLLVAAIFDLARIIAAVEDRKHMIGAVLTSAGFVARHPGSALGLYGLLFAAGLLLFAPYLLAAQALLPAASILGLLALQQTIMIARHWLRVTGVASMLALYRGATGPAAPELGAEAARSPATQTGLAPEPGTSPLAPARRIAPAGRRAFAGPIAVAGLLILQASPPAHEAETRSVRHATGGVLPSSPAAGSAPAAPPPTGRPPLSSRVAAYRIEASLDAARHRVTGQETIVYRNDTRAPMPDLAFHLYMNAFSNTRTTYMRGAPWDDEVFAARVDRTAREGAWGYISIVSVRASDGTDLTALAVIDETVMRVPLPAPIPPGASARIEVSWETQLPRTFHRTGYWGQHHDVMQWFPKLAVYGDRGWKIYPFYRYSEFFADFGTYDVTLTIPRNYRVEATGVEVAARDNPDGTRAVIYHAEDVHDFAWIADPNLVLSRKTFSEGPYATAPVEIVYAHQPDRGVMAPRIFAAVEAGLRFYGARFMPYPYPRLVVDDLPMGLAGGTEYPMLFTISTGSFLPGFVMAPEQVTLHEFGHQYWYGILASNEFEEPWLDEGVNSYVTRRVMDEAFGPGRRGRTVNALFAYGAVRVLSEGVSIPLGDRSLNLDQIVGFGETPFRPSGGGLLGSRLSPFSLDLPGLTEGRFEASRQGYADVARDDPMTTPSWGFRPGSYAGVVYDKTDAVLETLGRMIGRDALDEALRAYVERHRFGHPTGRDLLTTLGEAAARARPAIDVRPAIEALVEGTGTVDFEVASLRSRALEEARGLVPQPRAGLPPLDRLNPPAPSERASRFETEVIVRRRGEVALPVDLLVRFESGEERRDGWDGKATWKRFIYETKSRAREAIVDPEGIYAADLDRNNNSKTLERQGRAVARLALLWLFWVQNYLHLAASLC